MNDQGFFFQFKKIPFLLFHILLWFCLFVLVFVIFIFFLIYHKIPKEILNVI